MKPHLYRGGNGFLHTHPDAFTGRCQAPLPFWYQVHKVLAGLMDMYVLCDNAQALDVATKLGDWACRGAERFSDEQFQKMLNVEHGGINEALANLAALTGQPKYLQLALRFNCTPEDSFWCCTGTGIENHAKYGESIYYRQAETALYVNLFIASELQWQARGLTLRQETEFPDAGRTRLVFTCAQPLELRLHIRHPAWAVSGFEIRVNDGRQAEDSRPGSYAIVSRTWRTGDTVAVTLPLALRTEGFRDNPRRVAVLHGPLVLCAETDRRSPPPQCPAVVADEGRLLASLRPVPGQPNSFAGAANVWRLTPAPRAADTILEPPL